MQSTGSGGVNVTPANVAGIPLMMLPGGMSLAPPNIGKPCPPTIHCIGRSP
jgi:hypothetical protein